jgi:hypothetical protein
MTRIPSMATELSDSGEAEFKNLTEYLDYCCQQHKTPTYLEVADAIDVQAPHRIRRVAELLEALMEYDQKHHQPLRAALVVSKIRSGLPGKGFFLKAQALGLMPAVTAEEFHQQCLSNLFERTANTIIEAQ